MMLFKQNNLFLPLILVVLTAFAFLKGNDCSFIIVKENDNILEKTYQNANKENKLIISRVFYKKEAKKTSLPLDSLVYLYDNKRNHTKTIRFRYIDENYQKQSNIPDDVSPWNCETLDSIAFTKKYLRKELSDLCIILTSTLPNGDTVSDHKRHYKKGTINISKYSNLNARFRNLSLEINKSFYNQILHSIKVQISSDRLIKESFKFENGSLIRKYSYKKDQMTVDINTQYHDSSGKHSTKIYTIHN